MNSPEPQNFDEPSLQATVYRLVRGNIESGNLPPGMPISEYRLAQELALSREPVGRALQQLESDGLIVRDQPRGYRVEGAPRLDGREMPGLEISEDTRELVRGRAEWQKIWNRVQGDLIASMPFGRYKVIESTMAGHYGVSRTVTRDLLARLEILGLIEREGRSQCFLRQLTPELLSELYEVRRLLEPQALIGAAPFLDRDMLGGMRDRLVEAERRYPEVSAEEIDQFETDLHVLCTEPCPNRWLVKLVRQSLMLVLATNRLLPIYLGNPPADPFFAEHRMVIELLLNRAPEAAASALFAHLTAAERKLHLRVAALQNHTPIVPPYLVRAVVPRRDRR